MMHLTPIARLVLLALLLAWFDPAWAQTRSRTLEADLSALVETPGVTGNEQALGAEIRARLKGLKPQTDNLGSVYVTLGSGQPHRLIATPIDEPGYVVSGITEDGYLRVQRLPQQQPHGLFDELHAAQPVLIRTRPNRARKGQEVYGVVAGLSVHLQPGRQDAPRVTHPDRIYIDIGASRAGEVRQAGVDLLDPVALDRKAYLLGFGKMTGVSIGDRFGAAALLELLRRIDANKLKGTLTVAFVTQEWASSRGLDRLLQHIRAEEMIYVGRMLRSAPRQGGVQSRREPGQGVSIATPDLATPLTGLAAELHRLGEQSKIPVAADLSAALPVSSYTGGPVLPERFAHLGVPAKWESTPIELIDLGDLENLVALLELYAQGSGTTAARVASVASVNPASPNPASPVALPLLPMRPQAAPSAGKLLKALVESYGVSGHEARVRETIARLLPVWAKPETDAAGNLILRVGPAARAKAPRTLFVAHMDEIGYVVRSVAEDGGLELEARGRGLLQFFAGHPVFVHTANGIRPGVLELPAGWDAPDFQWPRAQQGALRANVGARTAAEAEQLGIRGGDFVTVPKKYRQLFGARVNGRSFDDRVGCAALIAAVWALGPNPPGKEAVFVWSTEEEMGLRGALTLAQRMAADGRTPEYVFAVDTFVSSDSPLESKRFADAVLGQGFAVRAVDNSNLTARELADRVVALARANRIPVQYGVTGGGNDGAVFLRYGATDIPIAWPLRYSHSPGEVADTRDVEALGRIVAALASNW